jgi:hypothetical protein
LGDFSLFGRFFTFGMFTNITEVCRPNVWANFYNGKIQVTILTKNGLGCIVVDIFTNSSGHPASNSDGRLIDRHIETEGAENHLTRGPVRLLFAAHLVSDATDGDGLALQQLEVELFVLGRLRAGQLLQLSPLSLLRFSKK